MPIFVLKPAGTLEELQEKVPDFGIWTDMRGCVVVADDEKSARLLAVKETKYKDAEKWWLDPSLTKCELVDDNGERVLLANWPTG
jgi:hypothetical protein